MKPGVGLISVASLKQLLLAMAASIGYMSVGLLRGFSSPGVPSMQVLSPHLVPDEDAVSWVSSIPPLGAFVGSLCAGPFLQHIGRKRTLMISSPLSVIGWLLVTFAKSYEMLICGRIITGFCAGIIIPSAQVYVNESSHPEIRGVLGSLPALFMSGGILASYVMGAWLNWQELAGASAAFPAALLFVLLPLPESPSWLMGKGRTEEADKAMKWLHHPVRGPVDQIPMEERRTSVFTVASEQPPPEQLQQEKSHEAKSPMKALLRRPVLLPFCLSLFLMAFQQLSGIDAIVFYTVEIFKSSGSSTDEHLSTILVGLVQLVSNLLALFVVDRAGRRPLLLGSGFLMTLSMSALGAYFYLLDHGEAQDLGLLPLISLLIFMAGYSVGYCTLPYLMMGELLPVRQRSLLSSVAGSFNLGVMFIVIKTYHGLKSTIGNDGAFWLYAALCLISCVFVCVFVPETKGKSLEEIEEYFELKHMSKRKKALLQQKQEVENQTSK
ncbi:facilitated trehalose transporter Tret1-2 homolog isoform X2 [Anabrus simplex]|uniref:facilitated trehalose transporter Tret1-2 homolog isoform X2 n=1 Tax=Anabrus simplex TaxID=316456 RepID=UPI0034DD9613